MLFRAWIFAVTFFFAVNISASVLIIAKKSASSLPFLNKELKKNKVKEIFFTVAPDVQDVRDGLTFITDHSSPDGNIVFIDLPISTNKDGHFFFSVGSDHIFLSEVLDALGSGEGQSLLVVSATNNNWRFGLGSIAIEGASNIIIVGDESKIANFHHNINSSALNLADAFLAFYLQIPISKISQKSAKMAKRPSCIFAYRYLSCLI